MLMNSEQNITRWLATPPPTPPSVASITYSIMYIYIRSRLNFNANSTKNYFFYNSVCAKIFRWGKKLIILVIKVNYAKMKQQIKEAKNIQERYMYKILAK